MTIVQFVPRGTAFERIDPASLSATWALNGVDHRLWGAPTGEEVVRTDDGRIRSIGLHFRDGNRAAVVCGRLNGGGPEWIGVAAPANGAEKPKAKPNFKRGEGGKIVANSKENIAMALDAAGIRLAFDELRQCITVEEQPISDAIADKLWLELPKFRPTKTFFDTTIGYLARQNSFHPILRYLDALQWDGQLRLDTWLIDHLGAEDIPLNRAVGRITLIAAVRRLRQPGCKFDELPVLEGKQGTGKSTLLKLLAIRPEWFTDSLSLDASQKVLMEQTEGYWIIEVPDLQGYRKTAWEQLKATLSRSEDTARMAYGRHQERRPRRFIAIGTTNDHEYLSDPTGNRRIWPVRLDDRPINPTRFLAERDQLWAEASHYERAGESIRLDHSLWGAAADQQALRTNDDPWADKLREVIGDVEGRICTETLWAIVGLGDDAVSRRTAGDKRRIGSVMVALGWKPGSDKGRITVGGKRVPGWVRTERPAHVKVTLWEFCASRKKLYVMKER